ncbi:MAG: type II toxin-antitoxin system VapC family toxin [Pseudomonadota bacterium]|nr:type II toxin-antitoxin system VapC family toxin [Pseudomonadota bacterium]MDE3036929.1 type II toxin-antitoxin system VapC family toxin [Pseudomonadota bacterium]
MAKSAKIETLLDASAFVAAVLNEPGADMVEDRVDEGAAISSVNLAESISKLLYYDYTLEEIQAAVEDMRLRVIPFDKSQSFLISVFQPYIKSHNLSLADRACLAVALEGGYTVLTTDRPWKKLPLDVPVQLIR